MFVLDFLHNGKTNGTVPADLDAGAWEQQTEQARFRHASVARQFAMLAAAGAGADVLVSRVTGGKAVPSFKITPDGRRLPPPNTQPAVEREGCVRDSGRTCFCTPCRDERKAAR